MTAQLDRHAALDSLLNASITAWYEATAAKSLTMCRTIAPGVRVTTSVTDLNGNTPFRTWKLNGEASSYSEIRRKLSII